MLRGEDLKWVPIDISKNNIDITRLIGAVRTINTAAIRI